MNTLKFVTIAGLSLVLMLSSANTVFAQDDSSFMRAAAVSKRDAVILSALFPGLGQMTQGHKVKGISMFIGEATSLILFINANENYNTKQKIYDRDMDIFKSLAGTSRTKIDKYEKTSEDARRLFNDLKDQNDELDNLHTIRNTALIVAAGVYAYNIFDAIFISEDITQSAKANRIRVQSAMIDRNPGILLSKRF